MELSIIVVNWNTKELLIKCLKSISENLPVNVLTEVIVIDNGSNDGSGYAIKKLKLNKYQLKIVENKQNLGFAKAVNQGIRLSEGKSVLLLNSDTQVKPGSLQNLIKLEEKNRPAIFGAQMLNPDNSIQASCFYFPTVKRALDQFWLNKNDYFSKFYPKQNFPTEIEVASGGAMLISKEVIQKVGLLTEKYFMYFEDFDYCRKAKKAGFKVYYLPSVKIIHEHGASGNNLAKPKDQWKRLIPSSKIYHGIFRHYLIFFIIWSGQKIWKNRQ